MTYSRAFTQRSIAAGPAYPLFVVTCSILAGLISTFSGNPGLGIFIGFIYLFTTGIAGIAVFVPVLLLMKGRTKRFALIFAAAGFLAGFLPTFLMILLMALPGSGGAGAALNSAFWLGMMNGLLGAISGLLTRYWLRGRLRRNLIDSSDLVEIYA